jgi:hypothetical protein
MIMVDVSWEDQSGTEQRARARIENKSSGEACIRLNKKIAVGTKLNIEGQWERSSGEARYCRQDGRDYLVGIQKDKTEWPPAKRLAGKLDTAKASGALPDVQALIGRAQEDEPRRPIEVPASNDEFSGGSRQGQWEKARTAATSGHSVGRDPWRERRSSVRENGLEGHEDMEERRQPSAEGKLVWKGNICGANGSIWDFMGHKEEKQEELSEIVTAREETSNRAPTTSASTISAPRERAIDADEMESSAQLELLTMEDIYRVAGIAGPRKGYSINKIVEMLHSDYLRGLSKEMKRASVLMALDAAGCHCGRCAAGR